MIISLPEPKKGNLDKLKFIFKPVEIICKHPNKSFKAFIDNQDCCQICYDTYHDILRKI